MESLKRVCICGADDRTPVHELADLAAEFPWMEVGILLSPTRMGGPRYPSRTWLIQLANVVQRGYRVPIALHLCGSYCTRLLMTGDNVVASILPDLWEVSQAVQLNTYGERIGAAGLNAPGAIPERAWAYMLENPQAQARRWIFQLDGTNNELVGAAAEQWHRYHDEKQGPGAGEPTRYGGPNFGGLFDLSHGTGTIRTEYPTLPAAAQDGVEFGMSGGLGPDNLEAELGKMPEGVAWVCMESRVRSPSPTPGRDMLDMSKVRRVLEIAGKAAGKEPRRDFSKFQPMAGGEERAPAARAARNAAGSAGAALENRNQVQANVARAGVRDAAPTEPASEESSREAVAAATGTEGKTPPPITRGAASPARSDRNRPPDAPGNPNEVA